MASPRLQSPRVYLPFAHVWLDTCQVESECESEPADLVLGGSQQMVWRQLGVAADGLRVQIKLAPAAESGYTLTAIRVTAPSSLRQGASGAAAAAPAAAEGGAAAAGEVKSQNEATEAAKAAATLKAMEAMAADEEAAEAQAAKDAAAAKAKAKAAAEKVAAAAKAEAEYRAEQERLDDAPRFEEIDDEVRRDHS